MANSSRPKITPAMRLNVLKKFGAVVLCQICGDAEYVAVIQLDHATALINDGAHDEENLRPVCIPCHAKKSAREHKDNSKVKRLQRKHSQPSQPGTIKSRGFNKTLRRKMNGQVEKRT